MLLRRKKNSITNWLNAKGTPAQLQEIYVWDKAFRERLGKLAGFKPKTLAELTYEYYTIRKLPPQLFQDAVKKFTATYEFKSQFIKHSNIPMEVIIGPFLDGNKDKRSWESQLVAALKTIKIHSGADAIDKLVQCLAYEELKLRTKKSPQDVFILLYYPEVNPTKELTIEEKRLREGYALLNTTSHNAFPDNPDILLPRTYLRTTVVQYGSREDVETGKRVAQQLVDAFKGKIDDYDSIFPLAKALIEQKKLHGEA